MRRTIVLVLTGTAVVAAVQGGALAAPRHSASTSSPSATIRIEGSKKTLLLSKQVRPGSGWITKYGAPKGKCSGSSVQGALDRATHGQWTGSWNTQFNEYFVTSILGEKPPSSHDFWEIFINNKAATKGACDLKVQGAEQILFADTDGKQTPSALAVIGQYVNKSTGADKLLVRLIGYTAHGTTKPLAGVQITGNGIHPATTNAHGEAQVTDHHTGTLILRAAPKGYIRSETTVHVQ